ncbi:hypothetical protein VN24_11375 [Paenibacillus beijingensis]|uniref:Uncharacterized protein n=1 Tax=Paenibacillus beijingensis TaxID=1126833 RepID=A0A0D5NIX8_9BACL|nr:hypothetical protein VN24_11375 [Paenibacillus beijingensis]
MDELNSFYTACRQLSAGWFFIPVLGQRFGSRLQHAAFQIIAFDDFHPFPKKTDLGQQKLALIGEKGDPDPVCICGIVVAYRFVEAGERVQDSRQIVAILSPCSRNAYWAKIRL